MKQDNPRAASSTEEFVSELRARYMVTDAPRLEPGAHPAVLVIDFARGWTDPASPLAGDFDDAVRATASLLEAARRCRVPIVFTTVEYTPAQVEANLLCRKAPRVSCLRTGSPWSAVDARLGVRPGEHVLVKQFASAFFATDLADQLRTSGVDTLLVCGCVTSGCVRASVVDAAQHGFRPMVIRDAVADRSPLAHEANLLDVEARYGDVWSLGDALAYLAGL